MILDTEQSSKKNQDKPVRHNSALWMDYFVSRFANQPQDLGTRTGESPKRRETDVSLFADGKSVALQTIGIAIHQHQEHFSGKRTLKIEIRTQLSGNNCEVFFL